MAVKSMNIATINPKVGIFWLIPANKLTVKGSQNVSILLYFAQDITTAEHLENFYSSTSDHYLLWNTIQKKYPNLRNTPYEKYPRGRVTFVADDDIHTGTFKLMADYKIFSHPKYLTKLKRIYNITNPYDVDLLCDLHYRTK